MIPSLQKNPAFASTAIAHNPLLLSVLVDMVVMFLISTISFLWLINATSNGILVFLPQKLRTFGLAKTTRSLERYEGASDWWL